MDLYDRSFLHVLRERSSSQRQIAAGSAFAVVVEAVAVAAGIVVTVEMPVVAVDGSEMVDWKLDDSVGFRLSLILLRCFGLQHSFLPRHRPC